MEEENLKQFRNCQGNHWLENVVTNSSDEQGIPLFPHNPFSEEASAFYLGVGEFWRDV